MVSKYIYGEFAVAAAAQSSITLGHPATLATATHRLRGIEIDILLFLLRDSGTPKGKLVQIPLIDCNAILIQVQQ